MCGIAGVIAETDLNPDDLSVLALVNKRMAHRGPSSTGFFAEGPVGLAMCRLAIIDLDGGRQPLFSEDERRVVVANGEIYNHKELLAALKGRGHQPRSRSDIETIIHLHEERGALALNDLDGMFAFALYERTSKGLLLGRDRLGEKPLYLWRDRRSDGAQRLWFASELQALLPVIPRSARRLSPRAFAQYLTFQYIVEPETPFVGLTQLPPGHFLELSPSTLNEQPTPYWALGAVPERHEADPAGLVRSLLSSACMRMGTADVPVGVALSGGIDSSLVAALTAKHYPGQIHAFSVGYAGTPATDERSIAKRFAECLGIPFTSVELDTQSIADEFPKLVAGMDTPVADIAAAGYFAVSKAAREAGIPVLLSGMGGDEMFWGYDWTRAAALKAGKPPTILDRLRNFGATPERSILSWHPELRAGAALAHQLLCDQLPGDDWLVTTRPDPTLTAGIAVSDVLDKTWLLGNCLTLVDRVSMANSIEVRLPFLDTPLIDAVTGMRRAGLDDHLQPHKWLLLAAHGDLLPEEISQRRKQGFTPPVQEWMAAINDRYAEMLGPDRPLAKSGLIDAAVLERTLPQMSPSLRYKLTLYAMWLEQVAGQGEVM